MPVEQELPETILAKTLEGKLSWERLSPRGFVTLIGPNSLTIDQSPNGPVLRIVNNEGVTVQTFGPSGDSEQTVREIYRQARRIALHVDETLLDVKRSLDSL